VKSGVCTITVHEVGPPEFLKGLARVQVTSPYDTEFVEALKNLAPHRARAWDPEEKCWWFTEAYLDHLKVLAQEFEDAWLVERDVRINLHTGERVEQMGLFTGD